MILQIPAESKIKTGIIFICLNDVLIEITFFSILKLALLMIMTIIRIVSITCLIDWADFEMNKKLMHWNWRRKTKQINALKY